MNVPEFSSLAGYRDPGSLVGARDPFDTAERMRREIEDLRREALTAVGAANAAAAEARPVAEVVKLTNTARKAVYAAWAAEVQYRQVLAALCKAVSIDHTTYTSAKERELTARRAELHKAAEALGFKSELPYDLVMSHPDCQALEKEATRGGDAAWRQTAKENAAALIQAKAALATAAGEL